MKCPHCDNHITEDELKIDKVMAAFDFEKVHKAMTALRWTWRDEGVPTIKRLKETSRNLLNSASTNDFGNCMTGGFKAEKYKDGEFTLQFIVTETNSYEE
jgi:hypothetical protein